MKQKVYQYISICGLLLTVCVLLVACSGSDSDDAKPEGNLQNQLPTEISVKTNVMGMLSRANTIDSNSELQGQYLKIDAYYHDTETKYLNGVKLHYDSSWKFWDGSQVHYYWPIEGSVAEGPITVSSLDFVGFCPYAKPAYIGTPTYNHSTGVSFTCDMSSYMTKTAQAEMPEFLVGVLPNQTYATQTDAGGALPLIFKHPFALVKFVINAASGTHVQINSISIAGLYTGATCTYDGSTMSWGSYDDESKATMTITQTLKIGGTTEGTPFVVIPKDYGIKYLTVNATWDDWSNVTISDYGTDVNFNWEPGHIYTYNLTLDKYGLKVDIEKFTEQW